MEDQQLFARFTERARKVISLAEEEARRMQNDYIGAEHLLLGIVREGQGVGAKVLEFKGVTLEKAREAVEHIIGHGDEPSPAKIELTPRAKHIIESAVVEAHHLNHQFIGTEHLLLGLLREDQGVAAGALDLLDVDRDEMKSMTTSILHSAHISRTIQQSEQTSVKASRESQTPADQSNNVQQSSTGEGSVTSMPGDQRNRFDKFTERARKVLSYAQEEAQRFNHNYIGTEHLLLGLVREGQGVAAQVLHNLGVDLQKVRNTVEFIIGRGDRIVTGEIGLTPRAKKVIELAVDEARRLNHHYIGTEHILLGLVREGEGIAAGALMSLGVELDQVRTETLKVLGEKNEEQEQDKE